MTDTKSSPFAIALHGDDYDLLLEGLADIEVNFRGKKIAVEARTLKRKIENHAGCGPDNKGRTVFRLGFSEKEWRQFFGLFMAYAKMASGLRDEIYELESEAEKCDCRLSEELAIDIPPGLESDEYQSGDWASDPM